MVRNEEPTRWDQPVKCAIHDSSAFHALWRRKGLGRSTAVCGTPSPETNHPTTKAPLQIDACGGLGNHGCQLSIELGLGHPKVKVWLSPLCQKALAHSPNTVIDNSPSSGAPNEKSASCQTHPETPPDETCKTRNGRSTGIFLTEKLQLLPSSRSDCLLCQPHAHSV